jgi:hypothetical protein
MTCQTNGLACTVPTWVHDGSYSCPVPTVLYLLAGPWTNQRTTSVSP